MIIDQFKSKSREGVFYQVKRDKKGKLSCNCPGWIFKKKLQERSCRHIELVKKRG